MRDDPIRVIKPVRSGSRAGRPRGPFERMKESIREYGVRLPVQVRKIRDPKFKYERIVGEGRILACKELVRAGLARFNTVPAIVLDVEAGEIVGRFLAENVLRKKLPWIDKAKLIASEVTSDKGRVSGDELKRIAERYFVTPPHVAKLLRILQQAAPKVRETLEELTVEEAEQLTSLPATGQEIVVETLKAEGLKTDNISALVRKAQELRQGGSGDSEVGGLSKSALRASLRRVDEDLERLRGSLKLKRLHRELGPSNLELLLSDKPFRKALDRREINYKKFEEATS
jgi:ParB/RepB/Spo0J family partition protein